jgi:hypothetical protein
MRPRVTLERQTLHNAGEMIGREFSVIIMGQMEQNGCAG